MQLEKIKVITILNEVVLVIIVLMNDYTTLKFAPSLSRNEVKNATKHLQLCLKKLFFSYNYLFN